MKKNRAARPKPTVEVTSVLTPLVRLRATQPQTNAAGNDKSFLVLFMLALAIAVFGVATVPREHVRWRAAAILVSERRINLTMFGVALLVTASVLFWIQGT